MRMCVGCREMRPQKELLRIVKSPEDAISIDRVGKAPGRGAYVDQNLECLQKAIKTRALERALNTRIDEQVYNQLLVEIAGEE